MERICRVKSVSPIREFESMNAIGQVEKRKAIDVKVASGFEEFFATAFDRNAEKIASQQFDINKLYVGSFRIYCKVVEKNEVKMNITSIILDKLEEV